MIPLYWCHNRERPDPTSKYWVMDGWGSTREVPVLPSVAECKYDNALRDERCAGCKWANHDVQR